MFKFSSKTQVDWPYKMPSFLKEIEASKVARKEVADFVVDLKATHILSPDTLNCDEDDEVNEICVFEITVKTKVVPEQLIKEIDKKLEFFTLFIVKHEDTRLATLCYKVGNYKNKYYATDWNNNDDIDLPLTTSLKEIYKFMLSNFFTYPPFNKETVDEYVRRYNMLVRLDFQIGRTQSAIAHENQPKKKFEYNARLKEYKAERTALLEEICE